MKKYFIIEFGGEKEVNEMKALELDNVTEAINWIKDSMECDEEYFNIDINCDIIMMYNAQAFVSVEYETIVTEEMFASDIYSVEDIITSNLSIVSKITKRMVEE